MKVSNTRITGTMWAVLAFLLAAAIAMAVAWPRASGADATSNAPAPAPSFNSAEVQRGAQLAAVGNCMACHTADEAKPFAGGRALETPFGTVHSTNITPDAATGIGVWSEAEFRHAMRDGVSRDGHLLYPAFPYPYFTHLADADIAALYAYVMTRDPIRQPPTPNQLSFPLNFRPLVAGWNLLYLDKSRYQNDTAQSVEWNRGAYLANALGHCGACHSPRSAMGAERRGEHLNGGEVDGWHAPALNDAHSPSPQPWSVAQLTAYLRHGIVDDHAIAAGPMQAVTQALAQADERDVQALASYVHALLNPPSPLQQSRAQASLERAQRGTLAAVQPGTSTTGAQEEEQLHGAAIYAGTCARCHDAGREVGSSGALRLPLAVAVYDPTPGSLARIVLQGITPPPGQPGRWMPGYAAELTEQQTTALLAYLRRQAADAPPWPDLAQEVNKASNPKPAP